MCQSDFHSSKHWELLNWRATCSQVQAAGQGRFRDQQTAAASKNSNTAVYSAHYDSNMPNGSRSTTQTEQQQQLRRRWFENVCSERRDTTTTKNCNSASIHVVIKCWYWYVAICSFQFRSISIGSARGEGIFFFILRSFRSSQFHLCPRVFVCVWVVCLRMRRKWNLINYWLMRRDNYVTNQND